MTPTRLPAPAENHTQARYAALKARDRRFDGVFFVAVNTTGIYCRPVCRARLPLRRNCTFFDTAAEAELNGFRPCLRCRPELAPGRSLADATSRLAVAAHARITEGALNGRSLAELASDLAVSERHLRRAVHEQFGVSPVELAQTQRLLFAKQLLTETQLPVTRIAFASGFSSLSRFNTLFLERYRMSPSALRRAGRRAKSPDGVLELRLGWRPPYPFDDLLGFFRARAIPGVEAVDETSYTRSIRIGEHAGWYRVTRGDPAEPALHVEVADSLVPVLLPLRAAIRRQFDLDAEPATVAEHFASDAVLGPLVRRDPGLRLPGAPDVFEVAVRGVVGQQVSVAAARTLLGRLMERYGEASDAPGLTRLAVTPEQLAAADPADVREIGMPLTRAETLVRVAAAFACGDVPVHAGADVEAAVAALERVRGIGPWTAQYVAMRGYHWPDAFPAADLGVKHALRGTNANPDAWRPWRAYAVIHLWSSAKGQAPSAKNGLKK